MKFPRVEMHDEDGVLGKDRLPATVRNNMRLYVTPPDGYWNLPREGSPLDVMREAARRTIEFYGPALEKLGDSD